MMKRCLIILLLAAFVAGCGVKRKLKVETETKVEETMGREMREVVDETKDSVGERQKEAGQRTTEDEETMTVVRVVEYDTSRPVVEGTGRPPVAREVIAERQSKKGKRQETAEKQTERNYAEVKTHEERTEREEGRLHSEESAQATESRKRTSRPGWWLLGLVAVTAGVVYARRRGIL